MVTGFRVVCIPVLLYLAWTDRPLAFLVLFTVCILSDCVDGYLARKLGQESEQGAKLDSGADFAMYMCLIPCAFRLWPEVFRREAIFILGAIVGYVVPVTAGIVKYGRLAAFHTWGAKISAVLVGISVILMFGGVTSWPFRLSTPILLLAGTEQITMMFIVHKWQSNVPSLWHALKLRRSARRGPGG